MKVNERLRDAIFHVIENQVAANDPAETAITLKRFTSQGYSEIQAKQLIGQALAVEWFEVMKNNTPINETPQ
jgi:hypothetical protein